MEKDDVGIDDNGQKDHDSEDNMEELDSKALDSKAESTKEQGEKLSCMIADAGNANKSDDHVGHCVNEMGKDLDDIKNNEKKDKIVAQTETEEPMVVEGSTSQMDVVTMNKEKSSPTSNVNMQPINKQSDAKNKVTEHTEISYQNADTDSDPKKTQIPVDVPPNEDPGSENAKIDKVLLGQYEEMEVASNLNEEKAVNNELTDTGKEIHLSTLVADENTMTIETATKHTGDHHSLTIKHEAVTPSSIVRCFPKTAGDESGETGKTIFTQAALPMMAEDDDGTPEEQAAFMKEIESFYRERATDFKPPKFYGQPLNCLKLWRAVIRLGGYERVTGSKLWRQVGESFHPPKTCTTVSWTFRIFYEKSLLEYEKNKTQSGELQLPVAALNDASGADIEGNGLQGTGSGRARRDAASRAMQGWHGQRLFGHGEVGEPLIKEKSISNMAKREKIIKTIGSLKQKRPNEVEHPVKAARVDSSKQLETTVVDIGPPADWVKINVRQTNDSFEVYALVPGLLREEVRVQSDPAGRLVITGQPEQVDNPWGITPFKKVISLPSRIDPLQTSAVVSLHGRLFVRVPFEQSNG